MSQMEQTFLGFLNRHPEVRASLSLDLVNTRALARFFMKEEEISGRQMEAVVAMMRRAPLEKLRGSVNPKAFSSMKIATKDDIAILDYAKSKDVVERIKNVVGLVAYDKNETLKVVVGAHTLKVIVDHSASKSVKEALGKLGLRKEYTHISEISLLFSEEAHDQKGIVAYVTSQLLMNAINLQEVLTCTPELLLYVDESQALKAFEVCKRIKTQ
ncbi:hypothetical protein HZB01_01545 [Candidatus Woesearchaeota archaeon]|nr:hypothetical protein [Candidatus Woesearchaeota archaeon]